MDKHDFKSLVVDPTLDFIGLGGGSSSVLLLGVAIIESKLMYLKQHPGPALGVYQIEPATHHLVQVWLDKKVDLKWAITKWSGMAALPESHDPLVYNLRYATCIARCLFASVSKALPAEDDAENLAWYHKNFYNRGGKTDVDESIKIFEGLIHETTPKTSAH